MMRGRCLCERVRLEIEAPLGPPVHCHCSQCRRASGSAFATNASASAERVRFVAGRELISEFESSPGKFRGFCSRCGSPIYNRRPTVPDVLRIRLGLLRDDPGVRPSAHIWVGSKAPWFDIEDDLPRFEKEPPPGYLVLGRTGSQSRVEGGGSRAGAMTARCLCEGARFEIAAELGPVIHCHCSMCRRASGTAFATNASVAARGFRFVSGGELVSEYESSPGESRAFCSRCGSPLYGRNEAFPEIRRVRLGTLDGDPGNRAVAHAWVGSKAPWFEIRDGLERFEEEPPARYCAPGRFGV
ncbi:MAG: GFA family protein [Candidatus Binatia bacterium]